MSTPDLRPSPIAGKWYPNQPAILRKDIERYLTDVPLPRQGGQLQALIVPHAGYVYSGAVAAHAFAWIRGLNPEIVAVVSPLHSQHPARVSTSAHAAYATPLGTVSIDRASVLQVAEYLRTHLHQELQSLAKDSEHAVEIELPFLQHLLDDFLLLPLMLREQSWQTAQAVGEALALALRGRNALLVASSDLSHFYPHEIANQLDAEVLRQIENLDAEGVIKANDTGTGYACGRGAIAAVLWAARRLGGNQARVLYHATSGDVTGDYTRVVGYGAAVVLKSNV